MSNWQSTKSWQSIKGPGLPLSRFFRQDIITFIGWVTGRSVIYRNGKSARKARYVMCSAMVWDASSVLHTKEGSYLLHFDRANMDSPARDLALYISRKVDLSGDQGLKGCLEYLASYEEVFPLTQSEKLLLAIFLLFPELCLKSELKSITLR